ncbi:hypothetical protein WSM22_20560 [Cytophagales bacterium WSM2-2]|nr:hypothetical protein WSM22_20560 [Cytophagales bacterium WSM2-2]
MALKEPILFDDSKWPLLIVTHPSEPADKEQTLIYLEKLNTYFERKEKFIAVFDVSGTKPPTAEHRFMVATWIKAKRDKIKPYLLGTAYVMPGLIQRLVLMTFLKLMDTTEIIEPVEVFNSMDRAQAWANERMGATVLLD